VAEQGKSFLVTFYNMELKIGTNGMTVELKALPG
jgi:hypothetical protein